MKRIVNIADGFKEAEEYDIMQQLQMKPQERINAAKKLKNHFYGSKNKDIKESRVCNVR